MQRYKIVNYKKQNYVFIVNRKEQNIKQTA